MADVPVLLFSFLTECRDYVRRSGGERLAKKKLLCYNSLGFH